MKKIFIIPIVAVILAWGCSPKKPAEKTLLGMGTDWVYYPETLNGKIKEIKEINYWAAEKDGKIVKGNPATWKDLDSVGSTKNFVALYDITGVMTRYDLIDENNVIRESSVGKLENNRIVKWEVRLTDSIVQYYIPEYDNKGYFIGGKGYKPGVDTLMGSNVITYDEKGNYVRTENFNFKNQKGSYVVFSLNEIGKVVEVKFFSKDDTLRLTYENAYNDKGFLAKQRTINIATGSSNLWLAQDLEFDDHGNHILVYYNIDDGKFKLVAERTYIYY